MTAGDRLKIAVLLFNLGGPDCLDAVRPFLRNLFSDPAILRLPGIIRKPLAGLIAWRRAPVAREIYAQMGGASPLMGETKEQAEALEMSLADLGDVRVIPVMRYWHPRAVAVAEKVADFAPDCLVLLPLYPQYSSTTTQSSLEEWFEVQKLWGYRGPAYVIGCYPQDPYFVAAHAEKLREALADVSKREAVRVLFSAHGLPKRILEAGDPYQLQVEQTVAAVVKELAVDELDFSICYQSRVGPLEWIGPSTEAEIHRGGQEGKALVVVPIAFVSEHSETLVELDIEYRALAENVGVIEYHRVPALKVAPSFIQCLDGLVREVLERQAPLWPAGAAKPKGLGAEMAELLGCGA